MLRKLFRLRTELGKFFGVGLMAYLVAVGGFNLLVHLDSAPLKSKPLTASILSGALSILVAYFGNRHWTWRDRKWSGAKREITLFFIINIISLGISVICLAISRVVLISKHTETISKGDQCLFFERYSINFVMVLVLF